MAVREAVTDEAAHCLLAGFGPRPRGPPTALHGELRPEEARQISGAIVTSVNTMSIGVLGEPGRDAREAFARLIPLLGGTTPPPTPDTVTRVLNSVANTVFAARVDGRIVGLLILVVLELPTGTEARIEDVVVDPAARRLGLGRALVAAAIGAAATSNARHVELTSAPHREAARTLYRSMGFEQRETGVFRRALV
jgi:GNAT superfamily N-acetyltransferase